MAILFFVRGLFALVSLAVLGAAGYLLWTWYFGYLLEDPLGILRRVREDWRLWWGLGLLGLSLFGRLLTPLLVAQGDTEKTRAVRGEGRMIKGAAGAELYVEEAGPADGPPIVLTHGWGLDSTIWFYAKEALSKRYRVISWDLPGLGRSKLPQSGEVSLENFAADLRTVIGLAGGKPAVLVGHSIGGMTIQTLARRHPEMFGDKGGGREIAGVVLVNTTYTNPLRTIILSKLLLALRKPVIEPMLRLTIWLQPLVWLSAWQSYLSGSAHLANRLGFGKFVTRSQLEHTTLLATRNPPAVQAKGDLAMFDWDATGAVGTIDCPVLVIGGDKDIVTKLEASETITASAKSGRLHTVRDVNHMGFLERADIYDAEIAAFTDGVQGGARSAARG